MVQFGELVRTQTARTPRRMSLGYLALIIYDIYCKLLWYMFVKNNGRRNGAQAWRALLEISV